VPAPRKYDEETRARAVRMYQERIRDVGESKLTARRAVEAMVDINPETLPNWVEREEIDAGDRPGVGVFRPGGARPLLLGALTVSWPSQRAAPAGPPRATTLR
jgi:transposase-like protein